MQDMNSTICNAVTNYGETVTLIDTRDNKTYTEAKLKDNKCWMTQHLALELSTSTALTSETSDLNTVSSWTPERNTIASNSLSSSTWTNSQTDPYSYKSSTASYAIYYNWTAAIASNDSSSLTTKYTTAPNSICPKGWRLPMVYNGSSSNMPNEFGSLLLQYGYIGNAKPGDGSGTPWTNSGYTKIQSAPINFALSGYVYGGTVNYAGSHGYLWSSTVNSSSYAYCLAFNSTSVYPQGYDNRFRGFPVRCVLR